MLVQKESLEKEKAARQQESNILLKYAQSLTGEHVTPAQMSQFLETYSAHGQKTVQLVSIIKCFEYPVLLMCLHGNRSQISTKKLLYLNGE